MGGAVGVELSAWLGEALRDHGWTEAQVQALRITMRNSWVDPYARSYAHGMVRAFNEFGIEGIKTNVEYMLVNLKIWKGEEARECKKILRDID